LADAYLQGRTVAKEEIGVANLPESRPWTIEQVLDRDFWPDE